MILIFLGGPLRGPPPIPKSWSGSPYLKRLNQLSTKFVNQNLNKECRQKLLRKDFKPSKQFLTTTSYLAGCKPRNKLSWVDGWLGGWVGWGGIGKKLSSGQQKLWIDHSLDYLLFQEAKEEEGRRQGGT